MVSPSRLKSKYGAVSSSSSSSGDHVEIETEVETSDRSGKGHVVENGFFSGLIPRGKAFGRVILLFVAFLYGTLNVTLRAVYGSPGPPAPSVLSLVRQVMSTVCFVPPLWGGGVTSTRGRGERHADGPMWKAALELAFWNFGAQGLINAGLVLSPAARASFLTQTSVVMTPLLSAALGDKVKRNVWAGCALALVGLALICANGRSDKTNNDRIDSGFNRGDVMVLVGALFWSTYIYRTSKLAGAFRELELQAAKTAIIAILYGGWALSDAASAFLDHDATDGDGTGGGGWDAVIALWSGYQSIPVWILLAYSAVGPGAVADVFQQRGQREVSASEGNVLLCFESVFALGCAYVFLGEVSSIREIAGGALIVAAAVLASL